MSELTSILSTLFLFAGCVCNLIASIGLFRFPDVHSRMHATGITDTLGTALILIGLALLSDSGTSLGKLFLILVFTLITSPTVSYVLANITLREQKSDQAAPSE